MVKTMRVLGTRDLKRYRGWKGTPDLIAKEHEKNRRAGELNGTWHNGVVDETQPRKPKADAANDSDGSEKVRPTAHGPRQCVEARGPGGGGRGRIGRVRMYARNQPRVNRRVRCDAPNTLP